MDKKTFEAQKRKQKILFAVIAGVVALALIIGLGVNFLGKDDTLTVTVGSKAYTEQQILGHMLADVIEAKTDYTVERKIGLGGTSICWDALKAGSIDVYVEYSSGMFLNALKQEFEPIDKEEIIKRITPLLEKEGLALGSRLGFVNDYELTVTKEFAEKHNLKTISDLKALQDEVVVAPTFEYVNRADGMLGINSIYGITFKNVTPMEAGLRYSALKSGEAQIINTFSTDGMKYKLDLVALEDTELVHLSQEAVIIFNQESLEKYPELAQALSVLEQAITIEDMMEMNYMVDVEGKTPEEVAKQFLQEKGIIS